MQVGLQIGLELFLSNGFYQVYEGYLLRLGDVRKSLRLEKNKEDLI